MPFYRSYYAIVVSDSLRGYPSPERDRTHRRYGPELPADSRQTQRLLAALGVAMPLASHWPASEIAAYYQRFVFSLGPSYYDEVHNAARARLLRKLLALPPDG